MSHAPSTHEHHGGHEHGAHDHGGMAKYVYVFFALCFLTTLSFLTYSEYWPKSLGSHEVKRMFMMAVSCTKAMLVILFFMHVKYEANWKYVLTIPASMMSIFLILAMVPDIGARVNGMFGFEGRYSPERLEHVGTESDVKAMLAASSATAAKEHGSAHEGDEAKHEEAAAEKTTESEPAEQEAEKKTDE